MISDRQMRLLVEALYEILDDIDANQLVWLAEQRMDYMMEDE